MLFYLPEDKRMGDVIPYYENGEYKLFYLGNSWSSITTKDQLHFYHPYATAIQGGTGSIVKSEGLYHMFYCQFTSRPYNRQYSCHAISKDLVHWEELPEYTFMPDDEIYEMSDWRDPHVVWNEEEGCWWMLMAAQQKGKTMRKGCVGLCKSDDLYHWRYCPPLYAPCHNPSASECPDLFRIGDWWYLTFSVYTDRFNTLYRMSRSPKGPWITPTVDTFDTRCFYAAKHGSDGNEHFLYGWNPRKDQNIWQFNPQKDYGTDYNTWDWGGTMIVHQLIQHPDGTLGVMPPASVDHALSREIKPTFKPLNGSWELAETSARVDAPDHYACLMMNKIPNICKLEADLCFSRAPSEFGVALQVDADFASGYYFLFEPSRNRIQYKTGLRFYEDGGKMFPYEVEQERPFRFEVGKTYHLRIFVQESILLLYLDDVAFGTRMFDRSGFCFGLFVSEGAASFENVRIYTEP